MLLGLLNRQAVAERSDLLPVDIQNPVLVGNPAVDRLDLRCRRLKDPRQTLLLRSRNGGLSRRQILLGALQLRRYAAGQGNAGYCARLRKARGASRATRESTIGRASVRSPLPVALVRRGRTPR